MLQRALIGSALLAGVLALGALVQRLRSSGRPVLRTAASKVHRGVGLVAFALLVVLAATAVRLLLG